MKPILFFCLALLLLAGCKKEHNGSKIEIYILKSYTQTIVQATNPATISITDAVLEKAPLVADGDIKFYTAATATFNLKKDIGPVIKNYGSDKAFAVTVDKQPVYFGKFHPSYLSSIAFGVATIDPIFFNNSELNIQFVTLTGSTDLQKLDKRNDSRITNTLKASGRLR